jgi:DNA-binding SARP family transcriptional activator
VAETLWPEAANVRSSLNVTIHRLRKLLGVDEAILVESGKLRIDDKLIWSDVACLLHLCERIENLAERAGRDAVRELADHLLDIYRGPFCDGEDDVWLLPARDRYRSRFLTAAATLGERLEALGCWPAARELYLRALESEPLAETIYRGLIRCAHAQSDPAAALGIYRRCREMLSIVAGRKPSTETQRLVMTLGLVD